jgi:hypothetical protein
MTYIIPRWEYRIFAEKLNEVEAKIREFSELENTKQSSEVYLISAAANEHNVKVRDSNLDIKKLMDQNDGFEQWHPIHKSPFPINSDIITNELFPALNAKVPAMERTEYTFQQFIDELIIRHPQLYIVQVSKVRHTFFVNDCKTEVADVVINNAEIRTVSIESEDIEKLKMTAKMLGISTYENENYIKAIKKTIGMV